MLIVFLHQLRDHLKSLRLQVGLLVVLVFFAANGLVYSWKVQRVEVEEVTIRAANERRYEGITSVPDATGRWYRVNNRPLGSEFIAEGGFYWYGDQCTLTPATGEVPPGPARTSRTINHWVDPFEVVDWVFIVRLIVSFLCIVLGYDAISGEAEKGTLALALANPVARARFLAGKFAASLVSLMAIVVMGSVVSMLILTIYGPVTLTATVLGGWSVFLLGTALYIALFLFLAMGVSSLLRDSSSSLVVLVLMWVVLLVAIPQTAFLVGGRSPGNDRWRQEAWGYRDRVGEALAREGVAVRDAPTARGDDYASERLYLRRLQGAEKDLGRMADRALRQEWRQYELAAGVSLLSPGFAFQAAVEAVLGAGAVHYRSFVRQASQYRQTLRQFLRARDAADSDSPHLLYLPSGMSESGLDPRHVPRFSERPPPPGKGVREGVVPILVLCLEVVAALFFALSAFNRADVRG